METYSRKQNLELIMNFRIRISKEEFRLMDLGFQNTNIWCRMNNGNTFNLNYRMQILKDLLYPLLQSGREKKTQFTFLLLQELHLAINRRTTGKHLQMHWLTTKKTQELHKANSSCTQHNFKIPKITFILEMKIQNRKFQEKKSGRAFYVLDIKIQKKKSKVHLG